jgi:hypothetical protein
MHKQQCVKQDAVNSKQDNRHLKLCPSPTLHAFPQTVNDFTTFQLPGGTLLAYLAHTADAGRCRAVRMRYRSLGLLYGSFRRGEAPVGCRYRI